MTTLRTALTSDDMPPGPLSEDDLRRGWNQQADEHNKWESLGSCEQLEWAQVCAIAADRARAALKAEPEGEGLSLQWTDNMPPSEACRYDHCIAETPFGRFLITWKSWKEYDDPTVDETPWGDRYAAFNSVDNAKAACQQGMNERLARCGTPATPPAPEPGPTFQDAIRLAEGCHDYSGGHSGAEGEAWHGAIDTVVAALKKATDGPWDSQTRAVYGVGVEAQAGEVEA
jgi:hypothetical protein